jgi:MFS family permease
LHIMFSGIIFLLSFTQYESPRYLIKAGKDEEAIINMSRVRQLSRDNPFVLQEINNIQLQLQEEREATMGQGWLGVLKEMFLIPSNFYRIYLGLMAQILSQWSGAGSITLYAPNLFSLVGVTGTNQGLLVTAVFGIVKLVGAIICALFLVDVIGRKRSLLFGIALQSISMIYIAAFLTAIPQLGTVKNFTLPESQAPASKGAIFMIFLSGFGWALGWNSMQYLLTAELFPLRIRAMSTSLVMCFHFANQYGSSRALPNMLLATHLGGINPSGTFWFFAAVTLIGYVWVLFTIPETAGRDLESMDRLFSMPWYKIGMYGNRAAEEADLAVAEKTMAMEQQGGNAQHVESVREV